MKYLSLLFILFLAGCSSTKAVYNNYDTLVRAGSAVNSEQAKIIAQRLLVDSPVKDSYRVSYPDIKTGPLVEKYPGYWFVVFGHNWLEPISRDPMAGTYTELRERQYLVVINKKNGNLLFFGEWYPKRENDFDWVFDQHAYNRKDPLALPPYKHSKEIY